MGSTNAQNYQVRIAFCRAACEAAKIIQSTCFSWWQESRFPATQKGYHILKNHFYMPPSMASYSREVDTIVTHLWPIFWKVRKWNQMSTYPQAQCVSSREVRMFLSPVTFKKMAGTAITQHGLAAQPPEGSVTVAGSRHRDSSQGSRKWVKPDSSSWLTLPPTPSSTCCSPNLQPGLLCPQTVISAPLSFFDSPHPCFHVHRYTNLKSFPRQKIF